MGTHALTIVRDGNVQDWDRKEPFRGNPNGVFGGPVLICMYHQYDGYPEGHGRRLKELLQDSTVVNGIGHKEESPAYFNGMGCLAAYLVSHFKDGIGGVYLAPLTGEWGADEFCYVLTLNNDNELNLLVSSFDDPIYDGSLRDFDPDLVQAQYMGEA